jgi:hypothetical protein
MTIIMSVLQINVKNRCINYGVIYINNNKWIKNIQKYGAMSRMCN